MTWQAHEAWWQYFGVINEIIQPAHAGYTAWTPIYSETPYYMLQCDTCFMIGPDMFDRFARPELAATCERLSNAFYHLDGKGQLAHLDSLLAIPNLKGVQWVPGAGQPGVTHWPEVYRRIREAGKLIQFFASQDEKGIASLEVIADQLGSAEGVIMIGDVPEEQEAKALALLDKYGVV
jgi:hypothetical protein